VHNVSRWPNLSPNAVSGELNCSKMRFQPGLCPYLAAGDHSASPDFLAALRLGLLVREVSVDLWKEKRKNAGDKR